MTASPPLAVTADTTLYEAVLRAVEADRARLLDAATETANRFYEIHWQKRTTGTSDEWGRYIPIVSELSGGVGVYWAIATFYGSRESRKLQPRKFGRSGPWRYLQPDFPDARDWEWPAIEEAENTFEMIRRRTDVLGRMMRAVKAAAGGEGHDTTALVGPSHREHHGTDATDHRGPPPGRAA